MPRSDRAGGVIDIAVSLESPPFAVSSSSVKRSSVDEHPTPHDQRYRGRRRHFSADFEHSAYVLLIDKQGRQRVGFPFEQLESEALAADMKALLREP